MKIAETCDLGFAIDERIADGYYYAKSMRILAHPEIIDQPFSHAGSLCEKRLKSLDLPQFADIFRRVAKDSYGL